MSCRVGCESEGIGCDKKRKFDATNGNCSISSNKRLLHLDDDCCAVCVESTSIGQVLALNCLHKFHKECIYPWFSKSKSPTCPVCRKVSEFMATSGGEKITTKDMYTPGLLSDSSDDSSEEGDEIEFSDSFEDEEDEDDHESIGDDETLSHDSSVLDISPCTACGELKDSNMTGARSSDRLNTTYSRCSDGCGNWIHKSCRHNSAIRWTCLNCLKKSEQNVLNRSLSAQLLNYTNQPNNFHPSTPPVTMLSPFSSQTQVQYIHPNLDSVLGTIVTKVAMSGVGSFSSFGNPNVVRSIRNARMHFQSFLNSSNPSCLNFSSSGSSSSSSSSSSSGSGSGSGSTSSSAVPPTIEFTSHKNHSAQKSVIKTATKILRSPARHSQPSSKSGGRSSSSFVAETERFLSNSTGSLSTYGNYLLPPASNGEYGFPSAANHNSGSLCGGLHDRLSYLRNASTASIPGSSQYRHLHPIVLLRAQLLQQSSQVYKK